MTSISDSCPDDAERLMAQLTRILEDRHEMRDEDDPLAKLERAFFHNNWINCRDGLLTRTQKIRVSPEPSPAPRRFHFEVDCPFKSKRSADSPVELKPGPVRGNVFYRPDIFEPGDGPSVAVVLDPDHHYFHPHYSRRHGQMCLGNLPQGGGPFPLDGLLIYLYSILTYENRHPADAADREAAMYFGFDPDAMNGLAPAEPLY